MISKPDSWHFTLKSISSQTKDGMRSVSSAMSELKEENYVFYEKKSDGTGVYYLDEKPDEQNPKLRNSNLTEEQRISNTILKSNTSSKDTPTIFPLKDTKKEKSTKKLFANSSWNNISAVRKKLLTRKDWTQKYYGVDLQHYIDAVDKWSDKSGKKTTDRGWIAYVRDFMDRDIKEKKLVMRKVEEKRPADLTVKEISDRRNSEGHINH